MLVYMAKSDTDILAEYYQSELAYLRSAGSEFASKFPKIARRLDLSNNASSDPHVERLIESFAFLTGKLQKQIDDQFPEIANTLLDVLYKPLVLPTPSCVMINFKIDQGRAAQSPGFMIPKDTLLHATSHSGEACTFMTSHDLELWPLQIESAQIVSKEQIPYSYYVNSIYYLKIRMKYNGKPDSREPKKLRFYIVADALLRNKIFAALFSTEEQVILSQMRDENENFEFLTPINPVGLEENESLFPYPPTIHRGFRILQEYFAFPDKFFGFEINIPESKQLQTENFLYIPISENISMHINEKNFSLSAVPAINLFPKITEPLRLDYKQVEYCLVPDYRKYNNHEIYYIQKMVAVDQINNDEIEVPEFFAPERHSLNPTFEDNASIFWKARRKKSYMQNLPGEDVYVSFVDTDFNPQITSDKIFYAYTLCTNRHMAEQVPVNGALQIEVSAPVEEIYCIDRPTIQKSAIRNGEVLWKLISMLSLNSFSFDNRSIERVRNILEVFVDLSKSNLASEVEAIVSITSSLGTKRIDEQSWRGFIRGSNIEITFDDSLSNQGLPLSMVFSKFLTSFTSINTFTEVTVKNVSKGNILRKWKSQFGNKSYL